MTSHPACPHCEVPVDITQLRHQGMFKSYRECPNCQKHFEVDPNTKRRQAFFIVLALISLVLTLLLYFRGVIWLVPACVSYVLLAVLIYWANKKVFYVPARTKN